MSDKRNELREALAEYAHVAWAGWMEYLLSKCRFTQVDAMSTLYSDLPEEEKEADCREADKMLAIIEKHEKHARDRLRLERDELRKKLADEDAEQGQERDALREALERIASLLGVPDRVAAAQIARAALAKTEES